jgi:hypothetical protein
MAFSGSIFCIELVISSHSGGLKNGSISFSVEHDDGSLFAPGIINGNWILLAVGTGILLDMLRLKLSFLRQGGQPGVITNSVKPPSP